MNRTGHRAGQRENGPLEYGDRRRYDASPNPTMSIIAILGAGTLGGALAQ
jgi:hypothetical protein